MSPLCTELIRMRIVLYNWKHKTLSLLSTVISSLWWFFWWTTERKTKTLLISYWRLLLFLQLRRDVLKPRAWKYNQFESTSAALCIWRKSTVESWKDLIWDKFIIVLLFLQRKWSAEPETGLSVSNVIGDRNSLTYKTKKNSFNDGYCFDVIRNSLNQR